MFQRIKTTLSQKAKEREAKRAREREVREQAQRASKIDSLIKEMANLDREIRAKAAHELDELGWEPISDYHKALHAVALQQWDVASSLGIEAILPLLFACTDRRSEEFSSSSSLFMQAREALKRIKVEGAATEIVALMNHFHGGIPYSGDAAMAERLVGISIIPSHLLNLNSNISGRFVTSEQEQAVQEALAGLGEAAVMPLISLLRGQTKELQDLAIVPLGQIGDPRAVEPLLALAADSSQVTRREVMEALGKIGDEKALDTLLMALDDKHYNVRESAVKALAPFKGEQVISALASALKDEHKYVRRSAFVVLAKRQDQDTVPMLLQALGREKDDYALEPMLDALGELGDARAVETLISMGRYGQSSIALMSALAKIGEPAVYPLKEIIQEEWRIDDVYENRRDYRPWAISVLARMDNLQAIEILLQILQPEYVPSQYGNIRTDVIKAFGEARNKHAIEPLTDIWRDKQRDYLHDAVKESLKNLMQWDDFKALRDQIEGNRSDS